MAISPSQAVPLFFVKFQNLIAHLRGKIVDSQSLSRISQYILVRDATFFVIDFFTGDRASDLGRLLASHVRVTCYVLPFLKLCVKTPLVLSPWFPFAKQTCARLIK